MPFCTYCGSQEPDGMAFCGSCGQSMTSVSTLIDSNNTLQQNTVEQTTKDSIAEAVPSVLTPLPPGAPSASTLLPTDDTVAAQASLAAKNLLPLKPSASSLSGRVRFPGRWGIVLLVLIVLMGGGGIWARLSLSAPSAYDQYVMKNGIQFGFDAQHSNFNPYESQLSPATVAMLAQAWTATHLEITSSPVVANDTLYAGSVNGKLYVFKAAGCGHATCSPLWTAATGGSITSSPAMINGVVYVISDYVRFHNSKLYAFKAAGCGQPACLPLWTATTGSTTSSPVVVNGVIYVSAGNNTLYAFKAAGCGQPACLPLWTAAPDTVGYNTSPTVANGIVYVSSDKLYAFKADGCGQVTCSPLWTATPGSINSPVVTNGMVYMSAESDQLQVGNSQNGHNLGSLLGGSHYQSYSHLSAFRADGCGHATCSPLWTVTISGLNFASPAVANGVVYIDVDNKLYAFKVDGCGHATCSPLWSATVGLVFVSPIVANSVVYVSANKLYAFKANGCGHATCSPLWSTTIGNSTSASPVVANGMVYVGAGVLYAFHRK